MAAPAFPHSHDGGCPLSQALVAETESSDALSLDGDPRVYELLSFGRPVNPHAHATHTHPLTRE